ncbi:MAG: ribonuclease HI family protein [Candidatus Marsarchaeota archaeon]|nr:ribonuclease HI family protein [Candidatus Marsarchaeota archaeon]
MKKITIYTDGAARGNPGESASGYIVYGDGKEILKKHEEYNGIKTNNYAEYNAIMLALDWCLKNMGDPKELDITIYSDSQLVVKQLNGIYKVKSPDMIELNDRAKMLIRNFGAFKIINVPRETDGIVIVDAALNHFLDRHKKH